jgi:hypothetical protein
LIAEAKLETARFAFEGVCGLRRRSCTGGDGSGRQCQDGERHGKQTLHKTTS